MQEYSQEEIQKELNGGGLFFLYLYTPLCGTCQVANRMLLVVSEMLPNYKWGKANLNYLPSMADRWEIESVPCLIICKSNLIIEKIYAFHSVPFLYEKLTNEYGT